MKKVYLTLIGSCFLYLFVFGQTNLVVWNFADANNIADAGLPGNLSRTISNNATGTTTFPAGPSGSCQNYILNNGWDNGSDTKYWEFSFETSTYESIVISFDVRS